MTNPDILETAKKYNWASVTYDLNQERLSLINDYLIGENILEVGCGGGAYSDYMAKKGFNVIALDQSLKLLNYAKKKGYKGEFLQGDIGNLPFSNNYFDCSYCFDVLEHVNDNQAYAELTRVTKKRIIFAVPQADNFFYNYGLVPFSYQDETHLRYYTPQIIKNLINSFTYKKIKIIHEGVLPLGKMYSELSKFDAEKQIIQDLLFPSMRINSLKNKALNNKIFKSIACLIIKIVFNKNKIKRILFEESNFQKMNAGLFIIVDL